MHTIANTQCLHPVRLRKPRHMQLEREHDYTSPVNRRRSQRVSFQTIAMMILNTREHSRSKRTSAKGVNWTDVSDTDSFNRFHHCRHQNGKRLRRQRRGWFVETDCKSGWNTRFYSGVHRGMPHGVVPRDYPKKAEAPFRIESVFDATIFSAETGTSTLVALRPSECKEFSREGSKEYFVKITCKIRNTVRKGRHTSRLDSMPDSGGRKDPGATSLHIYDAAKPARSTSSNCDGGLSDRVPKRQPDLATRMMLEQASSSPNGDYGQSTMFQLFLDCIDRAVESSTELVSIRVRFMHSEDNQCI